MTDPRLDLLDTPVAFARLDGALEIANRAFRAWTASASEQLGEALAVELTSMIPQLAAGERVALARQARTERGREFSVEYALRLVAIEGRSLIAVEGRDLSRIHEKEAMIQSFARTIEIGNRVLHVQKAEIGALLDNVNSSFLSLRRLLDSVDQGFATLDREGRLMTGRSAVFDRWFDTPPSGALFADCLERLSSEAAGQFQIGWMQLEDGVFPLELSLEQLPVRMLSRGRHFRLAYKPELDATGELAKLLVVISDVSSEIERERSEAFQRDLLRLVARFSSDRAGFYSFLRGAEALVGTITADVIGAPELMRAVHTLKGNCALFGAEVIARHCHDFESRVAELVELPDDTDRHNLGAAWRLLRERLAVFLDRDRDVVMIARGELEAVRRRAGELSPPDLAALVDAWLWDPAEQLLRRIGDQVQALAERLGKGEVELAIESGALYFQPARWEMFWAGLVHLVRNIADHGLESPEARAALGKPPTTLITLRAYLDDDRVVIEIGDDGAGIDWAAVAVKARERGMDAGSRDALVRALFADGLSTRARVTEQSGRGVGLAAVRAACDALGGSVVVESEHGRGTLFRFAFPAEGVTVTRPGLRMRRNSAA